MEAPNTAPVEISSEGKFFAGVLLITFTLAPIWLILAFWPDRMPAPKELVRPLYIDELYHIRLAGIPESVNNIDSFLKQPGVVTSYKNPGIPYSQENLIDLNTIILMLVAAAGFLGNMIHIATSFTNFVGAEKFRRSWTLWYFVKPFTAAALALGLYFVFRGGFLNYSADAFSINLFGILTISVLAGLFTDRATLKLAEVFDVVFSIKKEIKSDDTRPDRLEGPAYTITGVSPANIDLKKENLVTITGTGLDKIKMTATINEEKVDIVSVTTTEALIKYLVPETQMESDTFLLRIKDQAGVPVHEFTWKLETGEEEASTVVNEETADDSEDEITTGGEPPIKG